MKSMLLGIASLCEAPPQTLNPSVPTPRPRAMVPCVVVADLGGNLMRGGRVVMVETQSRRLAFRAVGRPVYVRPDWN